jgi:hypothetical protein
MDYSQGIPGTQVKIAKKAGKKRFVWRHVENAAENAVRTYLPAFPRVILWFGNLRIQRKMNVPRHCSFE